MTTYIETMSLHRVTLTAETMKFPEDVLADWVNLILEETVIEEVEVLDLHWGYTLRVLVDAPDALDALVLVKEQLNRCQQQLDPNGEAMPLRMQRKYLEISSLPVQFATLPVSPDG